MINLERILIEIVEVDFYNLLKNYFKNNAIFKFYRKNLPS